MRKWCFPQCGVQVGPARNLPLTDHRAPPGVGTCPGLSGGVNRAQGAYAPSHGSLLQLPAITVSQPVTGRHRSVEAPTPFIAQPAGGSERGCTPPQEADKLRQTE
ncbi:hypothetical protein SRHO_G00200180 [Serrasalmus rhombeus]